MLIPALTQKLPTMNMFKTVIENIIRDPSNAQINIRLSIFYTAHLNSSIIITGKSHLPRRHTWRKFSKFYWPLSGVGIPMEQPA